MRLLYIDFSYTILNRKMWGLLGEPREGYAEFYLGIYDYAGSSLCGVYRTYGRCDQRGPAERGGGHLPVHHYGRGGGAVDGIDGNCKRGGTDSEDDQRNQSFLDFMFPKIPKKHPAREYIATNLIANILGLGWACTPAGLKAMEELAKLEEERGTAGYVREPGRGEPGRKDYAGLAQQRHGGDTEGAGTGRVASTEMCNFLILNISSLQLIPVNMIAYRQQYGSINPAGVIAPAIVATLISTMTAIVYCKVKEFNK